MTFLVLCFSPSTRLFPSHCALRRLAAVSSRACQTILSSILRPQTGRRELTRSGGRGQSVGLGAKQRDLLHWPLRELLRSATKKRGQRLPGSPPLERRSRDARSRALRRRTAAGVFRDDVADTIVLSLAHTAPRCPSTPQAHNPHIKKIGL
jgi:hypothetical protein